MAIPSDFAGLVAWHEGDSQPEIVGDPVATLVGLGGTSNSQTQATAANRPVLITGANGYKAIQFDNSNDTILLSTSANITARPLTVFVAYAPRSASQGGLRVLCGSNNWLMGPRSESGLGRLAYSSYIGNWIAGEYIRVGNVLTHTLEQPSASNATLRVNGVSQGTNTGTTAPGQLRIGGTSVFAGEPAYADIYGIAVYNTSLAAVDRAAVETYFDKFHYPTIVTGGATQAVVEPVFEAGGLRDTQLVVEQSYEAGGLRSTQLVIEQSYEAGGVRVSQLCVELYYQVPSLRFWGTVIYGS